jgi:uncharacterized membrane protein
MRTMIAIACFACSFMGFLHAVITEYRQSRDTGPIARVPTLQWAVLGAMLVGLGLYWLPEPVPWWAYAAGFFGTVLVYGACIARAGR